MKIKFNDEIHEVTDMQEYGYLPLLTLDDGTEWYIAESREKAGEKAREYWQDMAENDPQEFTCIVGEKTLVAWALGQHAGPGNETANSLDGWLDIVADHPEEEFAGYDGIEVDVQVISRDLWEELGWHRDISFAIDGDAVIYRHN